MSVIINKTNCVFICLGVANNEYEIESILYDDTFGSKTMYLVKWKNYPMDQCTWEPYRNLTNCQELLNSYTSNKIVLKNIKQTDKYRKLYDSLSVFTDQEFLEKLHILIKDGFPSIDEKFVLGTIAYLSTVAPNCRSEALIKLVKHNLLIIEVSKKRKKQIEKLENWQKDINKTCSFYMSVINNVDFEGPPKKFIYVDECVAGVGVNIPNDPPVW